MSTCRRYPLISYSRKCAACCSSSNEPPLEEPAVWVDITLLVFPFATMVKDRWGGKMYYVGGGYRGGYSFLMIPLAHPNVKGTRILRDGIYFRIDRRE